MTHKERSILQRKYHAGIQAMRNVINQYGFSYSWLDVQATPEYATMATEILNGVFAPEAGIKAGQAFLVRLNYGQI